MPTIFRSCDRKMFVLHCPGKLFWYGTIANVCRWRVQEGYAFGCAFEGDDDAHCRMTMRPFCAAEGMAYDSGDALSDDENLGAVQI